MKEALSRFAHWYFSKRALPFWCILVIDCLIIYLSEIFVFALNNGVTYTLSNFWPLSLTFAVYMIFYLVGFRIFHTYTGIIRYSSFVDLQRVGFAVFTGLALTLILKYSAGTDSWLFPVRARDLGLAALLSIALMWSMRVLVKFIYDSSFASRHAPRAFIYGVKSGGIGLAKSIRNQDPSDMVLAGFVSDVPEFKKMYLMGVRVYPNDDHLIQLMKQRRVSVLLVSPAKTDEIRANQKFTDELLGAGIKIRMAPHSVEWDGKSEINHTLLKEVDIEDLLPRDKIEIDMNSIGKALRGKSILITGAAGSIGSEIVRQVATFGPAELMLIDQAETPMHDIRLAMASGFPDIKARTIVADIANANRMRDIFAKSRPNYVFHAAAYKHVPMMEDNPAESILNNVNGTRIIADLSVEFGVEKFVMVSTDKAVNPTNVMGCSKRICEIYVQSLDKAIKDGKVKGSTQFVTTRFGNVLGSNGSVIPLFKEQIRNGGPLTVTHPDIIRFFMLIPEACKLVLEAGVMGNGGEIFVFDMGKPVRIVDLAKRMIRLSGARGIEIKFTGLRDGEKLYEETLAEAEHTKPTFHPKINISEVRQYDYAEVCREIGALVDATLTEDDMQLVRRMKEIVPEYVSQHSVYEVLDRP